MFLQRDWIEPLSEFNVAGVRYLVIGAAAIAVPGEIRGTDDFDVWVQRNAENAERVRRALAAFGAPVEHLTIEELQSDDPIYQIGVKPLRIDILTAIDGVEFEDAWANRIAANDGDVSFPVLSRGDLIKHKRAAGRPKDMLDVETLEQAQG